MKDANQHWPHLGHRRRSWAALACAFGIGAALALLLSSADALFLSRVGSRHLGTAFAASSAVSMVVLWWVGALADRRDRGQLLCFVSYIGVAIIGVLLVATSDFPRASAVALLIVGKQVGGALELLLWVVIADRFTAREARKLLPWVVAANGCGAALGAIFVGPLALFFGVTGPLGAALVLLVLVSGASQLLRYAPDKRVALIASRTRARGAKAGLSLLWQRPLAKWLAILVACAGVFAPIMYYLLGVSAAAEYSSEVELAGFFGEFRAYVQVVALFAQITIAPWLSRRVGIGVLLVIAPLGALMVAMGVGWRDELAWIVAGQALTRILDTAIQNPAEQLIQNLLPQNIRGRVAGLVGGIAKRSGAIFGGLAASLVIVWPTVFTLLLLAAAGVWLLVAIHLWRHFAEYAVTELATTSRGMDSHALALRFVSERDLLSLRKRLRSTDRREQSNALALLERLRQHAKVDAVEELLDALTRCIKLAPQLRLALRLRLGDGDTVSDKSRVRALKLLHSGQAEESGLALEILSFVQLSPVQEETARALASRRDSVAGQLFKARLESKSVLEELSALGHDAEIVHQLRYEIVHASRQNSQ
ncbi:MAG: MFS transporter, partial [Kofleriaceae bacterium]|nr:MFS transporter [Kofleriaceae bacterium]